MAGASRAPITRPLLECLLKIRNLNEFSALREYLKAEREYDMTILTSANDDRQMHLAQGAVRRMDMILEVIERSAGLLEKERRVPPGS